MTNEMTNGTPNDTGAIVDLRTISPELFEGLGLNDVAYVKQVKADDGTGESVGAWAIHAANGEALAMAASRELALASIIQNDMEAVSAH